MKQCCFCHRLARQLLFLKICHMKASLWSKVGYLEVISGCRLRSLYHQNQVLEYPQPPLCPCVSTYIQKKAVLLLSTGWLLKCTRRNEKVIFVNLGLNKMDGAIWVLLMIDLRQKSASLLKCKCMTHLCEHKCILPDKFYLYWKPSASNIGC